MDRIKQWMEKKKEEEESPRNQRFLASNSPDMFDFIYNFNLGEIIREGLLFTALRLNK